MGASEAKGRRAGGSAGGASLAPIKQWPYIDHTWPWNHYSQRCLNDLLLTERLTARRGITTTTNVCTTYCYLKKLDPASASEDQHRVH